MPARTPRASTAPARALATLALVGLVVLGAATATPWRVRMPDLVMPDGPTDRPSAPPPPPLPGPPQESRDSGALTVVVIVVAVLGALLILALLYLLARRALAALRSTPEIDDDGTAPGDVAAPGSIAPAIPLAELQDAVQLALARVDAAATPHDAVVAAWVAFEDAAAHHGHSRDPAQTPTEFTTDVLAATPVPPDQVSTLRRLYSEARFTDRPVTPAQVDRARDALRRIARTLDETPAPAPPTKSTP